MRRLLSIVVYFVDRLQRGSMPSVRRWFGRLVAAPVALGLLIANPPAAVDAAGSGERVELVGSATSSVFAGSEAPGRPGATTTTTTSSAIVTVPSAPRPTLGFSSR